MVGVVKGEFDVQSPLRHLSAGYHAPVGVKSSKKTRFDTFSWTICLVENEAA